MTVCFMEILWIPVSAVDCVPTKTKDKPLQTSSMEWQYCMYIGIITEETTTLSYTSRIHIPQHAE
jgi:hypothetical protein